MGWTSAVVKKELKNLEWTQGPVGWRKSGVLVEFSDLAFHFTARYTANTNYISLSLNNNQDGAGRDEAG